MFWAIRWPGKRPVLQLQRGTQLLWLRPLASTVKQLAGEAPCVQAPLLKGRRSPITLERCKGPWLGLRWCKGPCSSQVAGVVVSPSRLTGVPSEGEREEETVGHPEPAGEVGGGPSGCHPWLRCVLLEVINVPPVLLFLLLCILPHELLQLFVLQQLLHLGLHILFGSRGFDL